MHQTVPPQFQRQRIALTPLEHWLIQYLQQYRQILKWEIKCIARSLNLHPNRIVDALEHLVELGIVRAHR
jgi:hypothetical protein